MALGRGRFPKLPVDRDPRGPEGGSRSGSTVEWETVEGERPGVDYRRGKLAGSAHPV